MPRRLTNDLDDEDGESLADALTNVSVQSRFDKTPHRFVPQRYIDSLITRSAIRDSLFEKGDNVDEDDEALIDYILRDAKRLFAITVLTGFKKLNSTCNAMFMFRDRGFTDRYLPLEDLPSANNEQPYDDDAPPMDISAHKLGAIGKPWTQAKIRTFCHEQWKLLAPVFSTNEDNHDLTIHTIPFIATNNEASEGSFGFVRKYIIHADHIQGSWMPDIKDCPNVVAVKEIKKEHKTEQDPDKIATHWASEAKALAKMNSLNQDHIVRFITAFRRCLTDYEEHYLMFEWADGGNLRDLWNSMKTPLLGPTLIKAALRQLSGLAQALKAAHNLDTTGASYRHGDLKPANILWFRDGTPLGKLKIGDWGEAKSHNLYTELRPSDMTAEYGTRRYEAPEVVTGLSIHFRGQAPRRRSRLYDVWAMGCITLEFIVWLLYGVGKLEEFNSSIQEKHSANSPFYKILKLDTNNKVLDMDTKKVAEVHDEVVRWMDTMAQDGACRTNIKTNTALGDLLNVVREQLLVVKLPQRTSTYPAPGSNAPVNTIEGDRFLAPVRQDASVNPIMQEPAEIDTVSGADVPFIAVTPATIESNALPPQAPARPLLETKARTRATAITFCESLNDIVAKGSDEKYWTVDHLQRKVPIGSGTPFTTVSVEDTSGGAYASDEIKTPSLIVPELEKMDYDHPELNPDTWEFRVDNDFAKAVFQDLSCSGERGVRIANRLCAQCCGLRDQISRPSLEITYIVMDLKTRAQQRACDLCVLLWQTCERYNATAHKTVRFEREHSGSFLKINGSGVRVLSIFTTPGNPQKNRNIQIGFSALSQAGSSVNFRILQHWLEDCVAHHAESCQSSHEELKYQTNPSSTSKLPTRLLDVSRADDNLVKLWEPNAGDEGSWLALSHPWGNPPHFSTRLSNYEQHLAGMALSDLPQTFQDAVKVTCALGFTYLWIDSLCIIQGTGGDFQKQSTRMEEVYSGASCVIAASCSTGHHSGFLKPRKEREYVTLQKGEHPDEVYHICQVLDNFNDHVLHGPLNRRGWVLQEHALARRTIFFTENQTYWECGHGVRCETMTYMKSNSAAFLGDPNFPRMLNKAKQGERIIRCQDLYKRYSRLGLAQAYDRPTAIDGMQQRLLRTMRLRGGFGIFDEGLKRGLLRRSLLWCRAAGIDSLNRIKFPTERGVCYIPSWSWMAFDGAIDYLELKFAHIDWADLQSPWYPDGRQESTTLYVNATTYNTDGTADDEYLIILDTPDAPVREAMCVILGTEKGTDSSKVKRHYVLFVRAVDDHWVEDAFERMGTGYLPDKCIGGPERKLHIY